MKSAKVIFPLSVILATAWLYIATAGDGSDKRSGVAAGQKAPTFEAAALGGKTIKFPADYKGKVVLLDFWATWCGPCRHEIPNVVEAYQKYHAKGFEVLSVSLDKADQVAALNEFVKDKKMTWPQIYDGGYWKTPVAVAYGVRAIPCPVLVDGDTGLILAEGDEAVGNGLEKALGPALASKEKKK